MDKYMSRVKHLQEQKEVRDERTTLVKQRYRMALIFLSVRLTPDAFDHLMHIAETEQDVYREMFKTLVPPQIIQNLEVVVEDIMNGWRPPRIVKDGIINLYRKTKGIDNIIRVGKQGDFKTLDAFLKEDNG